MGIAVMPGFLVSVMAAGRHQLVKDLGQIALEPRLVLDGADGPRTSNHMNIHKPGLDTGITHETSNIVGQVVHIAVSTGGQAKGFLIDRHSITC